MKEIKTANYIKKEAIWSLPGDPNLPPGVTQRMIDDQVGPDFDEVDNQKGETEIDVNWPEFNEWFITGGASLPGDFGTRAEPSSVWIEYTYSYDYNTEEAGDVKAIQLKDYKTGQIITDPDILEAFVDYYINNIKSDIKIAEESNTLEKSPDYNPMGD